MDRRVAQKSSKALSRGQELLVAGMTLAAMLGIYTFVQSDFVQDSWRGMWYEEPAQVAELRQDLELTKAGERVFLATRPAIEDAEEFNAHCGEHRDDVSLLGCYNEGNIYIYDVKSEALKDSHKVTAAHELLHAVWSRMGRGEQADIKGWLEEVKLANEDWAEDEIALYEEAQKLEELYTRVGTKLKDIPEGLEEHYGKYFANRAKIVEYYESYQAPFWELQKKIGELKEKIDALSEILDNEREAYERKNSELSQRIKEFNRCADMAGCFESDAAFLAERNNIKTAQESLARTRDELNQKIDEYNKMVVEYQNELKNLGELSDAMNSNIENV